MKEFEEANPRFYVGGSSEGANPRFYVGGSLEGANSRCYVGGGRRELTLDLRESILS